MDCFHSQLRNANVHIYPLPALNDFILTHTGWLLTYIFLSWLLKNGYLYRCKGTIQFYVDFELCRNFLETFHFIGKFLIITPGPTLYLEQETIVFNCSSIEIRSPIFSVAFRHLDHNYTAVHAKVTVRIKCRSFLNQIKNINYSRISGNVIGSFNKYSP